MDEVKNPINEPEPVDAVVHDEVNPAEENENVIQFPGNDSTSEQKTVNTDGGDESTPPDGKSTFDGLIDPSKPLTQRDMDNVGRLISQIGENVKIVQSIWEDTYREYKLTDHQMKALYSFNIQNRDPKPDTVDEDDPSWDSCNGIDKMTDPDITNIFGDGHAIWGVDLSQTKDRIKGAMKEFIEYLSILKEFRNINNAYAILQNTYEDEQINELQKKTDETEDPEAKAKMQASIDLYWKSKYLGFLADPLEEADVNRIVNAYTNKSKFQYWMDRTGRKMKQLHMSSNFLMEIYKFEEVYLDEKYHRLNNILLLYFMYLTTYVDAYNKEDLKRSYVVFMYNTLDNFVQNRLPEEKRPVVLENITALVDNFVGKIPEGTVSVLDMNAQ